jgi:hypothetical protein
MNEDNAAEIKKTEKRSTKFWIVIVNTWILVATEWKLIIHSRKILLRHFENEVFLMAGKHKVKQRNFRCLSLQSKSCVDKAGHLTKIYCSIFSGKSKIA